MTVKQKIMARVALYPGTTDTELENFLGVRHQAVNQACRQLEQAGLLTRRANPEKNNNIGNYPSGAAVPESEPPTAKQAAEGEPLQEEDIKHVLTNWLSDQGWRVETAWGHAPGVDIDARRGKERWLIEIKGPGSRQPMRVNYFLSILGETLQRMDDPVARYSIALPDMAQYRGLWERLPALAKERTAIDILFVDADGNIDNIK